jgi:hypothetical protein
MISSIGSIAVALLFSSLARWWIGREFDAPPALVCGLAVWTVVECGGNVLSMFLNGASVVRFQVIVASLFGVVCVAVKIYSTRRFGMVNSCRVPVHSRYGIRLLRAPFIEEFANKSSTVNQDLPATESMTDFATLPPSPNTMYCGASRLPGYRRKASSKNRSIIW